LGEWLERFDDQDFSLTDAVSFAVMSSRGIAEAITLDRHFVVAGFRVVPAR
jgi:predicted nucleic acid-binding protein